MPDIKALTIKVDPKTELPGVEYAWDKIPNLEVFTKNIIIPEIAVDQDGNTSVDISSIVSGMPTAFARANLFRNALDAVTDSDAPANGLMLFYKSLINEWKGLISCIALNYKDVQIERVPLVYSDGKKQADTDNIYEPAGAFGNMLFERQPLWCDQSLAVNADKVPFIDIISFNGNVVGATSPDCFLFTSVSYRVTELLPFVSVNNNRFIDPLQSDLKPADLAMLYGYANHILNNIDTFRRNFDGVANYLKPDYSNVYGCIQNWIIDMVKYQEAKGYPKLNKEAKPEVGTIFKNPFGLLFNYTTELYGAEGIISSDTDLADAVAFDPKDLLLPDTAEIAQIDFGKKGEETKNYLQSKPLLLLRADTKGEPDTYAYFALPLTPLALNVFGANLTALAGLDDNSPVKSRITATYDPGDVDGEKLIVQLKLFTKTSKEIIKQVVYRVIQETINGQDILLWPNFISRQWNRYFLYSEIPHNDTKFQASPFIGDSNNDYFRIFSDKEGLPLYLASKGRITPVPEQYNNVKIELHITANNAVADNQYKYEIYESNQPFRGIKFAYAGSDCGFGIIRYDGTGNNPALPTNLLKQPIVNLAAASLGVDFGSTNTSIAYHAASKNGNGNGICPELRLKNRRVSLLSNDSKNNNERPAMEDEIFFFQNDEIVSNSIKSVLTIHDPRRLVNENNIANESLVAQAIKGGFPCFEKNLPIETAVNNRYILNYARAGRAELIYNMKWSTQTIDKSYKTAYLSSLLLHVYAELFADGLEPHTLKWSYPSSMGNSLLGEYRAIWDSLTKISPIASNIKLIAYPPAYQSNIGNANTESFFTKPVTNGWGEALADEAKKPVSIATETAPIRFDFKELRNDESLTEACAVANYLVNSGYSVRPGELVICFDIGGSTTDITVLCQMEGGKAMIKQNSIRFAAQRVAEATRFSPNFKSVLLTMCQNKNISIQGLNKGENKFCENTAPYYFEQLVDRLDAADYNSFYLLLAADCKEMMSVNLYVTGLIMYYAGQLTYRARTEIIKSEDAPEAVKKLAPKINIAFAGKGARIFDWFSAVNTQAANEYYTQMFIRGIGGEAVARKTITPINYPSQIININGHKKENNADVKYEVSKGLAIPASITPVLVPKNKEAIEILGEDHFCIITPSGDMNYLKYGNSITPEMMEQIGTNFISSPPAGEQPCPRFIDFADLFYNVASSMFGLKMSQADFTNGFQNMNIESYIKADPDFIEAQRRAKGEQKKFDYVAPIIILEGMKFLEAHLLKGIQKQ